MKVKWMTVVLFIGSLTILQAQAYVATEPPKNALTENQVRRFLKTEIAVSRLQKQIQAHTADYEQGERGAIKAFYKKRAELVKKQGWDLEVYEDVRERVFTAKANIREYENHKRKQIRHQKDAYENRYAKKEQQSLRGLEEVIAQIKENDFLSEEKKKEMVAKMEEAQERMHGSGQKIKQAAEKKVDEKELKKITRNKTDWPAVRPYLEKLQQLTDWYSGNITDPPVID